MEEFKNWLINNKNVTRKVSMDIASRLKRAIAILGTDKIVSDSLGVLETDNSFKALSVSVKSQIRRAVKLYIEYNNAA